MGIPQTSRIMLSTLIEGLLVSHKCPQIRVKGITLDSRKIGPGFVFVALQGSDKDGRAYIPEALKRGAVAVLVDLEKCKKTSVTSFYEKFKTTIPILEVKNLPKKLSLIAARFYGAPSTKLKVTAITGTNGKTTCAHLYANLSALYHKKVGRKNTENHCGYVGTLGHGKASLTNEIESDKSAENIHISPRLTTPDAISMQCILDDLYSDGCDNVVLEASSHALQQHRIANVSIDTAIFTNLSRDHLDYHGDLKTYADAKGKLFAMPGLKNAVINIDDELGKSILTKLDPAVRVITYSLENITADIYCQSMSFSTEGLEAYIQTPWGSGRIVSSLLGRFNLCNLLAVIASFTVNNQDIEHENFPRILDIISLLDPVEGRMELVRGISGPSVIVDYAHTPDALEKVLQALRLHCKGYLWVVFGCGGDRDIGKRSQMGSVAQAKADKVIVTSDNPRSENSRKIIEDIVNGINSAVTIEVDRREAIILAISSASDNDIVLIAGKGHEKYQIIGSKKVHFSDKQEASLALEQRYCQSGGAA